MENVQKEIQSGKAFKRTYFNHRDAGNIFLYSFIACYAVAFIATLIAMQVVAAQGGDATTLSDNLALNIITSALTPLTFLGIFFLYIKSSKISLYAAKIKFNLNWKTVLILIGISILCIFGLQYIVGGFNIGLTALGYKLTDFSLPYSNAGWYILNLLLLAVLPAIAEELVFRGVIFNGLRRNVSDAAAIFLSATLFTLMHSSLEQFIYPFILGVILAWLVLRTGSVVSSIIVHMCNNALAITLKFIEVQTGFDFMPKQTWLFWVLAVVLMAVVFVVLFLIDKFYFKKKSNLDVEKVEKNSEGRVPNLTMIIGMIVSAIILIVTAATNFASAA